jgi:hypothetical protein
MQVKQFSSTLNFQFLHPSSTYQAFHLSCQLSTQPPANNIYEELKEAASV